MIPTYECDDYLEAALRSVLDDAPEGTQIEVVDDCSPTGDPARVVDEVGRGRVAFHRQPVNVGHTRNFNTCIERARGELVHLLHGDDLVAEGFYRRMTERFEEYPEAGAAICRHAIVDELGVQRLVGPLLRREAGPIDGWLTTIAAGQLVQPPAVVVKRSVYEAIGGFDESIERYGEDWEMLVRVAATTTTLFEPEPLALYRKRSAGSLSDSRHVAVNMADMRYVMRVNRDTMARAGVEDVDSVHRAACSSLSRALLRRARRASRAGSPSIPVAMVVEAIRTTTTPAVVVAGSAELLKAVAWRSGLSRTQVARRVVDRRGARRRARARSLSPIAVLADMPASVRSALAEEAARPLPAPLPPEQHLEYRVGDDRVLHVYGAPADRVVRSLADRVEIDALGLEGVPAVYAVERTGDRVWIVEERCAGSPAEVRTRDEWFPSATRLLERLGSPDGPPLQDTRFWRDHVEPAITGAPSALREAVRGAWAEAAPRPSTIVHGDVRPGNLVVGPSGACLVGWEGAWRHGMAGLDLIFLALTAATPGPDASVVGALARGIDPPGRAVLGSLEIVGVDREHLRAALTVALSVYSLEEARAASRSTRHGHHRTPFRALLEETAPLLVG